MAHRLLTQCLTASLILFSMDATAKPVYARRDISSSCVASKDDVPTHFGILSGPWSYQITIYNKTTSEKGSPGQGLLDNIWGECHNAATQTETPANSLGYNPQTNALTSYKVSFMLPQTLPDSACVETAIQKAEHQTLSCDEPRHIHTNSSSDP